MNARCLSFLSLFQKRSSVEKLSFALHLGIFGTFCLMSFVLSGWLDQRLQERSLAELGRTNMMAVDLIDTYATQLESAAEALSSSFVGSLPENPFEFSNSAVGRESKRNIDDRRLDRLVKQYAHAHGVLAVLFLKSDGALIGVADSIEGSQRADVATFSEVSPVAQALLSGRPFIGVTHLYGREYMLSCRALLGTDTSIQGAACVGVDFSDSLATLKNKLRTIRIGHTGYLFILDLYATPGLFVLHPRLEGVNVLLSELPSIREVAQQLTSVNSGVTRYQWPGGTDNLWVQKLAITTRFEKWGWQVGVGIEESEIQQDSRDLRLHLLAFGLLMTVVLLALVFLTIRRFREAEKKLLASELRLRNLFELSPVGIVLSDRFGNFIDLNEAYRAMTGYEKNELLALGYRAITADTNADDFDELRRAMLVDTGRYGPLEKEYRAKDGRSVLVSVTGVVIYGPEGEIYTWSIVEDITERHQAELQQRLAAKAFLNMQEGVAIFDRDAKFQDVNAAYSRITGYSKDELLGQSPRLLKSGRHRSVFYRGMWNALLTEGWWRGEIWNRRMNGEIFPALQTISVIEDEHGELTHFVAVINDVSELKNNELRLQRMAHYDPLTDLPNRVLLGDRLQQAIAHAAYADNLLAICYLDLDNFKPINDQYGHEVGDRVLAEIASRLTELVHGGDTVARLGGDEFVLLLQDINEETECLSLVRKLLSIVTSPIYVDAIQVAVTASVGITLYPKDHEAPEILLRHADQAMYIAKDSGKNTFHLYDPSEDKRTQVHRQGTRRIEQALAAKEFVLYYQPKVDMRLGKVVGAEALIRWQHPERGILPPIEFLPLIEDSELIIQVGDWVIREALRQMSEWQAQGLVLSVSVNIAALQLQQTDFVQKLRAGLAEFPTICPDLLELEVLETAALDDVGHVSRIMTECQELGVRFALDDFGTGYSSLTYFKRLPANTLKIDQSFIRDMITDPEDLAIVEAVIGLTEAFRRQAVAEGVETLEHGIMLLHMGCNLAQGYSISRPLPPEKIPSWVSTWMPDRSWGVAAAKRWRKEDFPLVLAEVDHRRWVDKVLAYTGGEGGDPPEFDPRCCHFWGWFSQEGESRYGWHPEFDSIREMHEKLHLLGHEVYRAKQQGQNFESQMDALLALRDGLISRLHQLVGEPSGEREPLIIF